VPHGHRRAPAQERAGHGHGPRRRPQKALIERAYTQSAALGLALWCQDEAGPYQAIPHPGASWQPRGQPARQPHEYLRGGTAKLLTLFCPATGEARAQPVAAAPNAVLHPWLRGELEAILAGLPPPPDPPPEPAVARAAWAVWQAGLSEPFTLPADLPPLRLLLVWDNLTGHKTPELVCWLCAHGVMPLYTPLGGSWLNMAESVQRILVHRALNGQHPHDAQQVMDWLAATVRGWNAAPTPFVWGGPRQQRRWRARQRRAGDALHPLGGSGAVSPRPVPRRPSVHERLCA
jgi:hypothetical protein